MRIAMIGSRGIPAGVGGVERVVEDISRGLVMRGHEVIVYGREHYLTNSGEPQFGRSIITGGFEGKHLDTITHTATAVWDVLRRGVDVVHIHSPGPAIWSWVPALAHRKVVFTVHAPDWRRDKWSPVGRAVIRTGLSAGMRFADAVTGVSQSISADLSQRFGREVVCIPNSVGQRKPLAANYIRRWGLRENGFALHVGRIVPEKRLGLLLKAWKESKLKIPLVVAGDASGEGYPKICRDLAVGSNVLFIGPQVGEILEELYSNTAMVIQPSVLEGASLVLLESAAHARCVICTDMPANREILGDAGIYFPKDKITALTSLLYRYYNAEDIRVNTGLQAQRRVESEFSPEAAVSSYEQVYREVLQKT